jgi:IS5 family transposase
MQHWYSLIDPTMEDSLIEVPTMRRFAGIGLIRDHFNLKALKKVMDLIVDETKSLYLVLTSNASHLLTGLLSTSLLLSKMF